MNPTNAVPIPIAVNVAIAPAQTNHLLPRLLSGPNIVATPLGGEKATAANYEAVHRALQ